MKALLILVLLVCAGSADATSIVGIRDGQEVVLAADSCSVMELGGPCKSVCKIIALDGGKVAATLAGYIHGGDYSGYDLARVVRTAMMRGGSFDDQLLRIEVTARFALLGELPNMRRDSPELFQKYSRGQDSVVVVFLSGFRAGVPALGGVELLLATQGGTVDVRPSINIVCPDNNCSDRKWIAAGETEAIVARADGVDSTRRLGAPDYAEKLVGLEISSRAPNVGAPIDVWRLTPAGGSWVRRKADCPETVN